MLRHRGLRHATMQRKEWKTVPCTKHGRRRTCIKQFGFVFIILYMGLLLALDKEANENISSNVPYLLWLRVQCNITFSIRFTSIRHNRDHVLALDVVKM